MDLTFAHYRNRFCMFRTYYALATGNVRPEGFNMNVIELPDPPSREQEEALIRGGVQVANLYFPNYVQRKLPGAPIIGLCTEWKSTLKGNGIFVRKDGPIKTPEDLLGRTLGSHQGPHAIHRYLLRHRFGLDDSTLNWQSYRQEQLIDALKAGKVEAVVLLDQFFFRGEEDSALKCLYTDGEIWRALHSFPEMIKHMIAAREDLLRDHPGIKEKLLRAFRASFAWSEEHLPEIADEFMKRYDGDREALLASARYPRIEFTMTEQEQKLADAEMDMMVEVGWLPHKAPIKSLFALS
ncbi:MAG TPA: ABC transporter substrate-binding protein [Candidatus Binatia bacterium]|nr:ABC transporter substrate-binding protein [Candidatus Binatia bacterium]